MELSFKSVIGMVIPGLVLILGNSIDSSLKWRAEIEQRDQDRQVKILDTIIESPLDRRITVAEFYLKTNTFKGEYRKELELSLEYAKLQLEEEEQRKLSLSKMFVDGKPEDPVKINTSGQVSIAPRSISELIQKAEQQNNPKINNSILGSLPPPQDKLILNDNIFTR